ncbi:neutral/alkaline non-lysosomal ceramidase N-terminal domain-containing protein [Granulicatella seriolae]|uniref:Neutral ceramidase n=1 Tax=Granulicatella seriolae TaxID=2967226 RepID=A0ABT1WPM2_9LACT|nr:neutral/alkaline non-lysosomal ceramidase N-terminal domain-containing protein [Granulicatella seriolae]
MSIKFGYASDKIPIKKNSYLSGYYPIRKCKGIHDSLYVKSNTFYDEKNGTYYFFVAIDVIGIDGVLKKVVEDMLANDVLDCSFNVFLSATHTHSGPSGLIETNKGFKTGLAEIFGEYDKEFNRLLSCTIVATIKQSINNLTDFTYSLYQTSIEGVGLDRHNPKDPIDSLLALIELETKENQRIGIVNYSCHPTVLSHENKDISADYLFEFYNQSEGEFNQISFVNGSSANISTRFTRTEQSFHQAKIFGESLYKQLIKKTNTLIEKKVLNKIEVRNYSTKLKTKDLIGISVEQLNNEIADLSKKEDSCQSSKERRLLSAKVEGLRTTINMKEALKNTQEIDVHYTIVQFGYVFLVLLPAEITSELTKNIRQKHQCLIFSLTNDYLFYLVEEEKYVDNTYEAQSSFFAKGEAEKLLRAIDEQLETFSNR